MGTLLQFSLVHCFITNNLKIANYAFWFGKTILQLTKEEYENLIGDSNKKYLNKSEERIVKDATKNLERKNILKHGEFLTKSNDDNMNLL